MMNPILHRWIKLGTAASVALMGSAAFGSTVVPVFGRSSLMDDGDDLNRVCIEKPIHQGERILVGEDVAAAAMPSLRPTKRCLEHGIDS
jgi:hypothetical protein